MGEHQNLKGASKKRKKRSNSSIPPFTIVKNQDLLTDKSLSAVLATSRKTIFIIVA